MNRRLCLRWFAALTCSAALAAQVAAAAACVQAAPECGEWISLPGTTLRARVFRSLPLDVPNPAIKRALVIVHGGSRDAEDNLRHALGAAFLAGALDDTVIVSPRFASNGALEAATAGAENAVAAARSPARDVLAPDELNWVSQFGPRHWNAGGVAVNASVTSYEVIDEILKKLAKKTAFPNLRAIVVAGHSSGGQFVSRYHMVNRVHESLGVKLTYVIANPGAYTYLDALRPTPAAWPEAMSSAMPGYVAQAPTASAPAFAPYADARNCASFDTWPYGLKSRVGYAERASDEQLRQQVVNRPATFVFGELDVLPLVNFDISCPAMAQGASRLARGLAYTRYLRERYAARHEVVVVPGCGHHTRCMLSSDPVLPLLFPKD
jgi:pimeloyl-ACP methyl ester carboxylesterase